MDDGGPAPIQSPYQSELKGELAKLNPEEFSHAVRLLNEENKRVESGDKYRSVSTIELHTNRPTSNALKVRIPIKEFPRYNFVGKLLGPKGNTLKQMQQETGCKLSILGRGSMRDKQKEEELRQEGGKYSHLNDELHVMVECFAEGSDAYSRIAHAVGQIKRFMVPEDGEGGLLQPEEMGYANGEGGGMGRGMGRGGLLSTPGPRGGMGRGGMGGRGGAGQFGSPNGGRGGGPAPRGAPSMRGSPSMRGAPPSRGGPSMRGAPPSRGAPPMSRGAGASAPRGRGGMAPPPRPAPMQQPKYDYGAAESAYEADPYGQETSAYSDSGYGRRDPYAEESSYSEPASTGGDTQYFDYGHGAQGYGDYDDGGRGAGGYERGGMKPAAPAPSRPGGRGGMYRAHPYESQGRDMGAGRMGGRSSAY